MCDCVCIDHAADMCYSYIYMIDLTGHGDHNSGDGEEGGGDEAEVFHLEKGWWVQVGLEEKRGVGPKER